MTLNEPKTYGQFIQTDFLQKIVAYELNSGHVLIFYPTQVKLSGAGLNRPETSFQPGVKNWLIMVKNG
jgi:hypothetical protein